MKLTKSQLKEMIREELKLTEDFKNSEWEVYVADEKGREKVVKVAKSKRAGVILYNKLINSDKYHEVGMRVKGYNEGMGEGKLDEDMYSPSFKRMVNSWETLLEAILGPKQHSKEYKQLAGTATFKKWVSHLQNGDPKAIQLFPNILKLAQVLMYRRIAQEKNDVKKFEKNSYKALDAFEKIGKRLKV